MTNSFNTVEIGTLFTCNGNVWRKKTTRTAELSDGSSGAGPLGARWFYFTKSDQCNDRLDRALLDTNS